MKIWKRNSTTEINALGKVTIELSNGTQFRISEEFNQLVIQKVEESMKVCPQYTNQIAVE